MFGLIQRFNARHIHRIELVGTRSRAAFRDRAVQRVADNLLGKPEASISLYR